MKLTSKEARELLEIERKNAKDDRWIEHSICVGDSAGILAKALEEKGYNPINQIVGYLISGDPGYISSYKESRKKICKLERTQIIEVLLRNYLSK